MPTKRNGSKCASGAKRSASKGPHTPKSFPGHISANRQPGTNKPITGPKPTKPTFTLKAPKGKRFPNHIE